MGSGAASAIRGIALIAALVNLGLAIIVMAAFEPRAGIQFAERLAWVPALGLEYRLGLDGASVLMVFLTAFLTTIAILASWPWMAENPKTWAVFLLLLSTGVIGAFAALDAILFFAFWEMMLIPMYLLIGMLGGPRRVAAAVKFFVYTAVGSLLMLVAIIYLHFLSAQALAQPTFGILELVQLQVPAGAQTFLFLAFAFAFAIKVAIFPFHTWLPDAYTQAPTTVLVLGTMLAKVGAYGFIRFALPLFPESMVAFGPVIATLAVIGIIYGALLAIAQRNIVRLLAYSSIAHLGFIILGIFSLNIVGLSGAVIQMVNHGITLGGLFIVAAMIHQRTKSTDIDDLGGLARRWPVLTAFFTVILFSSVGLPGLNGFVGEFLILFGAYQTLTAWAIVATIGIVLAAVYLLWMFQRVMHGPPRNSQSAIAAPDLTRREVLVLVPILVLIFWIGIYPSTFMGRLEPSLTAILAQGNYTPAIVAEQGPPGSSVSQLGVTAAPRTTLEVAAR
jgi:NADH-quinone oxidoreductase subunit M